MQRNEQVRWLAIGALVAAIYAAWTIGLAPISYGSLQFRLSEIMVLLAFVNRKYIPGLVLGCLLANLLSQAGPLDVVFGTAATWIAVEGISRTKSIYLASIWPVLVNGLVVGAVLTYAIGLPFWLTAAQVAFGEFVVVSVMGIPLFKGVLLKNAKLKTLLTEARA